MAADEVVRCDGLRFGKQRDGRLFRYHADGNGNVTALIDSAQSVVAAYRYNSNGQLLGSSGSLAGVNTLRSSSKPWFQSEGLKR